MWMYIGSAMASGLILYVLLSTARLYRKLVHEWLPQAAWENRSNLQLELISPLLGKRLWRFLLVLPVAFLCTFIVLPYDLLKVWHWLEIRIVRLLERRTS